MNREEMTPVGWDSLGASGPEYEALPEDLTPGGIPGRPACWRVDMGLGAEQRPTGGGVRAFMLCTRPVNHTGRHAAGDGIKVRAVWP